MNPHEASLNNLATAFNIEAQKLDENAGDQCHHAAEYAGRGDVTHARECLDNATAYGHRAFTWSLAARRLEEALDRIHNDAVRAEGDAAAADYQRADEATAARLTATAAFPEMVTALRRAVASAHIENHSSDCNCYGCEAHAVLAKAGQATP